MTGKNGVSVCSWEEWEKLEPGQREREIYNLLKILDLRTQNFEKVVKVYAAGGGIVGGALTVAGIVGLKLAVGV